jgi:hypothetical protein
MHTPLLERQATQSSKGKMIGTGPEDAYKDVPNYNPRYPPHLYPQMYPDMMQDQPRDSTRSKVDSEETYEVELKNGDLISMNKGEYMAY